MAMMFRLTTGIVALLYATLAFAQQTPTQYVSFQLASSRKAFLDDQPGYLFVGSEEEVFAVWGPSPQGRLRNGSIFNLRDWTESAFLQKGNLERIRWGRLTAAAFKFKIEGEQVSEGKEVVLRDSDGHYLAVSAGKLSWAKDPDAAAKFLIHFYTHDAAAALDASNRASKDHSSAAVNSLDSDEPAPVHKPN